MFIRPLALALAAIIWGSAFVAQSVGGAHLDPYAFNALRSIVTVIVLYIASRVSDRLAGRPKPTREERKTLLKAGLVCGSMLALAITLQQFGLSIATGTDAAASVGKAGFLTAMYIVLVPVFSTFLHKPATLRVWISVGLSVIAMYLMCVTSTFTISVNDVLFILCAIAFCLQILAVDHFAPKVRAIPLCMAQFAVVAVVSAILSLAFETTTWPNVQAAFWPLLYIGVMSGGIAYTLQIYGQNGVNPAVASLLMSLESVFSLIFGFLILRQTLSARELIGCGLMFIAIVVAQLPNRRHTSETI